MLIGKHLIAGEWVAGERTFKSEPSSGEAHEFSVGTVDNRGGTRPRRRPRRRSGAIGVTSRAERAAFLNVRSPTRSRGAGPRQSPRIGTEETGLPVGCLQGASAGAPPASSACSRRYPEGRLSRPAPGPPAAGPPAVAASRTPVDASPIGPVAVFGASNFPLAFSTAGGDTASAFAAGCPVVSRAIRPIPAPASRWPMRRAAIMKPGAGGRVLADRWRPRVGEWLVPHPRIKAVGFTGSLAGGRALIDSARPGPSRSRSSPR